MMAGSMNRVTLVGRLGKDPEIRSTQSGAKIANLTVATSESWNDKRTGERKEATEWHRVVIFAEGLVSVAERYLQKGDKLLVEGSLMTRKWTDQSGQERYSTEIVLRPFSSQLIMLGGPQRETGRGVDQEQWDRVEAAYRAEQRRSPDLNDDVPF